MMPTNTRQVYIHKLQHSQALRKGRQGRGGEGRGGEGKKQNKITLNSIQKLLIIKKEQEKERKGDIHMCCLMIL